MPSAQPSDSAPALSDLLARPDIWRGDALASARLPAVATGFAALDAVLPGGGWPRGQITEILPRLPGSGELSLLLPALAQLTQAGRHVMLIQPPHSPWQLYAPAWADAGVVLERLILATPEQPRDVLWTAVESLRCPAIAAVLCWPDAGMRGALAQNSLRRLQTAAAEGGGCALLLRPAACAGEASPAVLRLALAATEQGVELRVLKRRGPPLSRPIQLALWGSLVQAPRQPFSRSPVTPSPGTRLENTDARPLARPDTFAAAPSAAA